MYSIFTSADAPTLNRSSQRRPLRDTTSQNAFSKFEDALSKKFASQLEGFSEEEYRQLENLDAHANMKGAFEFVDGFELDAEEEEDVKPARRARKRYAMLLIVAESSLTFGVLGLKGVRTVLRARAWLAPLQVKWGAYRRLREARHEAKPSEYDVYVPRL